MRRAQRLLWPLTVATLALYLTMIFWSLPKLAAFAGGLAPFDMRPFGYSAKDAEAFILALSANGKDFYLTTQHRLDLAYPLCLAATLTLAFHRLAPRRWAIALSLVALAGMVFDYLENLWVHLMVVAGPEKFSVEGAETASLLTLGKSIATTLVLMALLGLLASSGWRRWRAA